MSKGAFELMTLTVSSLKVNTSRLYYLWLPLGTKSKINPFWSPILEKAKEQLARWKSKYLSKGEG